MTAVNGDNKGYVRTRAELLAVAGAIILSIAVLWLFRFRGWYPHDEGTLGQAAERILSGQIPHRDFDDPYTGGLGVLHALVFRIGGISINALRSHLALVATCWFGMMFWFLSRWMRPIGAAIIAALLATFSVPLYPAAMPSWYVMFLACSAGVVLTLGSTRRASTLLFAGALIGLASLAKVTAVFALAGAIWAMVTIRQSEDAKRKAGVEVIAGAVLFCLLVLKLVMSRIDVRVVSHIAFPPIAVALAIAWREIRHGRTNGFGIDTELWRRVALLCVGAAIPAACYAFWLHQHDALVPFLTGLTAVVGRRSAAASLPPPSLRSIVYAIPLLVILLGAHPKLSVRPPLLAFGALALAVIAWFFPYIHADFWHALRGILPAGALLFVWAWPRSMVSSDSVKSRALIVFVPLAGMLVLSQYPFAAPIYFLYVLPLMLIALAAAVAARPAATQRSAAIVAAVYLLFGLVEVIPGSPDSLGMFADHAPDLAWLDVPRAHLLVPPDDAELYSGLVMSLDSLPPGPVWAGPDAPEIAFLSGRPDLNRAFFSFLTGDVPLASDFASQMHALGAQAIVVDSVPSFSMSLSKEAADSLPRYFPSSRIIGRFEIHSRGSTP